MGYPKSRPMLVSTVQSRSHRSYWHTAHTDILVRHCSKTVFISITSSRPDNEPLRSELWLLLHFADRETEVQQVNCLLSQLVGDRAWPSTRTLDLSVPPSVMLPVCTGTEPFCRLGGPGLEGSWQNCFLLSCFGSLPLRRLGPATLPGKACQICLFQPRSLGQSLSGLTLGPPGQCWACWCLSPL